MFTPKTWSSVSLGAVQINCVALQQGLFSQTIEGTADVGGRHARFTAQRGGARVYFLPAREHACVIPLQMEVRAPA